jgi:hypothetical protein
LLEKGVVCVVCPINVVIDESNKSQVSFSLGLGIENVGLLPSLTFVLALFRVGSLISLISLPREKLYSEEF